MSNQKQFSVLILSDILCVYENCDIYNILQFGCNTEAAGFVHLYLCDTSITAAPPVVGKKTPNQTKMKKLIMSMVVAMLLLPFVPAQSKTLPVVTSTASPADAAEAKVLLDRLSEIDAMDKSTLKSSEKRALRKEVRAIKNELSGGVYLSVGAILLIIILLIVLL